MDPVDNDCKKKYCPFVLVIGSPEIKQEVEKLRVYYQTKLKLHLVIT